MKFNVLSKSVTSSGTEGSTFLVGRLGISYQSSASASTAVLVNRVHQRLPFTITVDPDGGTASVSSIYGYAGEQVGDLPTASRGNSWHEGWKDVYGVEVTTKSTVSEHVRTITALYTKASEVNFSAETAISGPTSATVWSGHSFSDGGAEIPTAASKEDTGENFVGWYTSKDGGTKITSSSVYDGSYSTLYAHYAAQSYTVDLNSQWFDNTVSSTDPNGNAAPAQTNPDSSVYDGVYASYGNFNVGNGYAKMYIRLQGYTSFRIYIRSYAESSNDYTMAFSVDTDVSSIPSYSTSGVVAHTRSKQNSGMAISNYVEVNYSLDGGEHYIMVCYRKDGSVNTGNDRGYVLIPKDQ